MAKHYDTIIIGAGAAGMTAAIFAARAGEKVAAVTAASSGTPKETVRRRPSIR